MAFPAARLLNLFGFSFILVNGHVHPQILGYFRFEFQLSFLHCLLEIPFVEQFIHIVDSHLLGLLLRLKIDCFHFLLFIFEDQPERVLLVFFDPFQLLVILSRLSLNSVVKIGNLFQFGRTIAFLLFNPFLDNGTFPKQSPKSARLIQRIDSSRIQKRTPTRRQNLRRHHLISNILVNLFRIEAGASLGLIEQLQSMEYIGQHFKGDIVLLGVLECIVDLLF